MEGSVLHIYISLSVKSFRRYGSSIFVSTEDQANAFNPQCFLVLNSNHTLSPLEWDAAGINITFTKNIALFGSVLYTTSLSPCSWVRTSIIDSFDRGSFPHWPIFHIRYNH